MLGVRTDTANRVREWILRLGAVCFIIAAVVETRGAWWPRPKGPSVSEVLSRVQSPIRWRDHLLNVVFVLSSDYVTSASRTSVPIESEVSEWTFVKLMSSLCNRGCGSVIMYPTSSAAGTKVFQEALAVAGIPSKRLLQGVDSRLMGEIPIPSVALMDSTGKQLGLWHQFSSEDQDMIRRRINQALVDAALNSNPLPSSVAQMLHGPNPPMVVDTRPRSVFALRHIQGALNIPEEELNIRLEIEVPREASVLLLCGSEAEGDESLHHCARHMSFAGYDNATIVARSIDDLARGGVEMAQ